MPESLAHPHLEISFESEHGLLVARWKQFATGELRKEVMLGFIAFATGKGATKLLVDARGMQAASQEDEDWSRREIMPRVIALGLNKAAYVVGNQALTKMVLTGIVTNHSGMESCFFAEEEPARQWLGVADPAPK